MEEVEGEEEVVEQGRALAVVEGQELAEEKGLVEAVALVWEQDVGKGMDVHSHIHSMVDDRDNTGNHSSHSTCHRLH